LDASAVSIQPYTWLTNGLCGASIIVVCSLAIWRINTIGLGLTCASDVGIFDAWLVLVRRFVREWIVWVLEICGLLTNNSAQQPSRPICLLNWRFRVGNPRMMVEHNAATKTQLIIRAMRGASKTWGLDFATNQV